MKNVFGLMTILTTLMVSANAHASNIDQLESSEQTNLPWTCELISDSLEKIVVTKINIENVEDCPLELAGALKGSHGQQIVFMPRSEVRKRNLQCMYKDTKSWGWAYTASCRRKPHPEQSL